MVSGMVWRKDAGVASFYTTARGPNGAGTSSSGMMLQAAIGVAEASGWCVVPGGSHGRNGKAWDSVVQSGSYGAPHGRRGVCGGVRQLRVARRRTGLSDGLL